MFRSLVLMAGLVLLVASAFMQVGYSAESIRVITDRTESHLKPLFAHYTETTGVQIEAVYVDSGLLARLKAQPTEAHVVITKTAEVLEEARQEGLLAPFSSSVLTAVDQQFRDQDNSYLINSYRIRGMFLDKEAIPANSVTGYMDLIKPEYKGQIAVRSGYHGYNVSLFSQMAASEGLDYVERFITGLKANLARTPTSNDRGQVRAIHEGVADISIGNSYYYALMLENPEQLPWAEGVHYAFPEQTGKGAYVMRSGAALTKGGADSKQAEQFLEFLVGDFAQFYNAAVLNEYSITPTIPVSAVNRALADGQEGIVDGMVKVNMVPLREAAQHRQAVVDILNKVNFDQ